MIGLDTVLTIIAILAGAAVFVFGIGAKLDSFKTGVQLELKNINTHYGLIHILQDVSLTINKGEIVCLLGGNRVPLPDLRCAAFWLQTHTMPEMARRPTGRAQFPRC